MLCDVFDWLENTGSLYAVLGVNNLNELRVQVILPDGVTVLDTSKAKADNTFAKVSYYIDENQASRSYNMGRLFSSEILRALA